MRDFEGWQNPNGLNSTHTPNEKLTKERSSRPNIFKWTKPFTPYVGLDGKYYQDPDVLAAVNEEWRERMYRENPDFDRRTREGSSTSFELRTFSGRIKIPNSSQ